MDETNCRRCGFCCMSLPNWSELTDVERAFIRLHDKNAEEVFKKVVNGLCPNLKINKNGEFLATCLIYENRHNFCKAYKCVRARNIKPSVITAK